MSVSNGNTATVVLACLLLAGCNPRVYEWQLTSAIEQCKSRGGVDEINTVFTNSARCNNGAWVELKRGQ